MGIFAITLIVGSASLAMAGVPDVTKCDAVRAGVGTYVLMNSPNGIGNTFLQCKALGISGFLDGTITVTVRDVFSAPIANYPFEDITLSSLDGGMAFCTGGNTADASTDVDGVTQFQNPLNAGGFSTSASQVKINNQALSNTIALGYVSPDISGDGVVNLSDVSIFGADFYDVNYQYRSDLFFDGDVNLSDLGDLAAHLGAACP
jgi:hypothetical protein